MVNLFDIARSAQGGAWFDALSRQFALTPGDARGAVEAVLPAFALAFQRSLLDPARFGELMGMLASGQYAPFYDASAAAPRDASRGHEALAKLFGSRQAAEAVAAQSAAMAGVSAKVVEQMLPIIASTLLGGMFRYATLDGFADFLRYWADAINSGSATTRPASPTSPWAAWAEAVRAASGRPSPPPPSDPIAGWAGMMNAMLGAPSPPPPPPKTDPFAALSRMFETGREAQAQHLARLQAILDGVWGKQTPER